MENKKSLLIDFSKKCVFVAKKDWDTFEISLNFRRHPLLEDTVNICTSLQTIYDNWIKYSNERFEEIKQYEKELNHIIIDSYGLQEELTPDVEDKNVTVRKADMQRDIKSLISYAVGCMFGRYSLDKPGLIYAGGDFNEYFQKVEKILADSDGSTLPASAEKENVIGEEYGMIKTEDGWKKVSYAPNLENVMLICDENYFLDDIMGRFEEFIKVVYGQNTLEENLLFIAGALGGAGNPREIIRKYFLNDFFKDHCKVYQKRPIYWLFDSGKQNGFKALIYIHRYQADTIGRVRVNYLYKVQEKYENEIRAIDMMQEYMSDNRQKAGQRKRKEKLKKQLEEIRLYDEKLGHLALENTEIDLDDGVKMNYMKIQKDHNDNLYQILAPIK